MSKKPPHSTNTRNETKERDPILHKTQKGEEISANMNRMHSHVEECTDSLQSRNAEKETTTSQKVSQAGRDKKPSSESSQSFTRYDRLVVSSEENPTV